MSVPGPSGPSCITVLISEIVSECEKYVNRGCESINRKELRPKPSKKMRLVWNCLSYERSEVIAMETGVKAASPRKKQKKDDPPRPLQFDHEGKGLCKLQEEVA